MGQADLKVSKHRSGVAFGAINRYLLDIGVEVSHIQVHMCQESLLPEAWSRPQTAAMCPLGRGSI